MAISKSTLAAVLAAALLAACGSTPTRESTGEYIDDSVITSKVKAAFVEDKEIKAADITVTTFKGNVQLSGFAASVTEIDRAAQIASHVAGVKSLTNDIHLGTANQ